MIIVLGLKIKCIYKMCLRCIMCIILLRKWKLKKKIFTYHFFKKALTGNGAIPPIWASGPWTTPLRSFVFHLFVKIIIYRNNCQFHNFLFGLTGVFMLQEKMHLECEIAIFKLFKKIYRTTRYTNTSHGGPENFKNHRPKNS